MKETVQVTREAFRDAMVAAARAQGGAGEKFIADGHSNLWLDIAYDAAARLSATSAPAGVERLALEAIKAVTATTKDAVAGLSRIMAIARSAGVDAPYSELMAKPEVALIVNEPRANWRHLFELPAECTIPPAGWRCTRKPGHDGPCAALAAAPAPSGQEKNEAWHMAQSDAAHADADAIGVGYTVDGAHVDPRRVSVFRPMSYLETLAAPSGQEVAGGGHANTEADAIAMFDHLNCPACGGSGHVGDVKPAALSTPSATPGDKA